MLEITEILEISTQGVTTPVFCGAEDGRHYAVKGSGAGKKALVYEWIAGHLARQLGLPIPDFQILKLNYELLLYSTNRKAVGLLGRGSLFGSHFQENVSEITYNNIGNVERSLRARILAFDWWIGNEDRSLTQFGGNPNILWQEHSKNMFIIDHNVAFDLDPEEFWKNHVFRQDSECWTANYCTRLETEFRAGIASLNTIWNSIPEDWLEDLDQPILETTREFLSRFESDPDTFWRRI